MIEFVLQGPDDVNSVVEKLSAGHSVQVIAGEVGRRPKSWLVQDVVQAAVEHGATVRRPLWVTRGVVRRRCYMKSVVVTPEFRPGGDTAGVREPRQPSPPTLRQTRKLQLPRNYD